MIRLGIIGGGINSAVGRAHVAALRMTGKFELVSGCFSRNSDQNAASAIAYGCIAMPNAAETMDEEMIDRVVVLSPTPDHFGHVMTALRSKLPVLCEKALGATAEHAANLYVASDRLHQPLSCVFNYVFYAAVQEMRKLVAGGYLGQITHIHVEMPQSGYLRAPPQPWRLTNDGIYLDLVTHLHHLIWFLTASHPVSVLSCDERKVSNVGVVDYVSAQLAYEHFTTQLWVSKCSAGHSNGLRIRLYGPKCSAEWYQREPDIVRCAASNEAERTVQYEHPNPRFKQGHPTGYIDALANLYDAWADDPSHPDLSAGVAVRGLSLMHAMRQSAAERREVSL